LMLDGFVEHEPTTPAFPASFEQPTTSQFHEAEPAHIQGDPLMTPAFGYAAPSAKAEPELESESADAFDVSADDLDEIATPDSAEAAAHVPAVEDSIEEPAEEPGAFVTETMATLYLELGHVDKAIDIYR